MVVDTTMAIYTNRPEVPRTLLSGLLLSEGLSNPPLSTSCSEVSRVLSR